MSGRRLVIRLSGAALVAASVWGAPVAQARDNTGAILGAAAAGVAGGVIAGALLSGGGAPPPRPVPVYAPPPPPPVVVQERVVYDRADPQEVAWRLHAQCDDGNRNACIRFGEMIGRNRERRADWQRNHPEMFGWER